MTSPHSPTVLLMHILWRLQFGLLAECPIAVEKGKRLISSLLVRILRGGGQGLTFQHSGFTKAIRTGSQQLRTSLPLVFLGYCLLYPYPTTRSTESLQDDGYSGVGVVRALNLPPLANCALRGTRHTRLAQAVAAARARALRGPAAAPRHSIPHVALEAPQVPHLRGLRGVGGGAGGPARAGGPGLDERSPGAPSGPALTPPLASRGSARPPRVLAAANTRAPNSTCPESPGHFPFRSVADAHGPKLPRTRGDSCARRGAQEPQPAPCSTRLPARRSRTRGWRRRAARCWWRRVALNEHRRPRLGKGGGTRRGAPEVAAAAELLDPWARVPRCSARGEMSPSGSWTKSRNGASACSCTSSWWGASRTHSMPSSPPTWPGGNRRWVAGQGASCGYFSPQGFFS